MTMARDKELIHVCLETAREAGRKGKLASAVRLAMWIHSNAGRFTDDELRIKVNAVRAEIGMPQTQERG